MDSTIIAEYEEDELVANCDQLERVRHNWYKFVENK